MKYGYLKYSTVATCNALTLKNGQINYNDSALANQAFSVDTIATFTCNDRYYLIRIWNICLQDFWILEQQCLNMW